MLLQQVADAAFAGLAVNADDITFVFTPNIFRIDGQIRNRPMLAIMLITPFHPFGDRILMGTGEGSEYEFTCIWLSFVHFHFGHALIDLDNFKNVLEIQLRIDTMGIHIQSKSDNVHVPCSFSVTKQCSFDSLSASE
ncbi:hypothetical protein D3C77_389960 [compost metagenome]